MIARIVDISSEGCHLAKERGFLVVRNSDGEAGRIALDDLGAVIGNAHGLTYSNNLVASLAERGIPLVLCGPHHRPVAFLWPVDGHHNQARRMADQAGAGKPLKKRLWQQIVRAKITQQGATLEAVGAKSGGFGLLAAKVRSGDPENVEAQAARRYWPLLLGKEFRRDPGGASPNGLLNYGYAILRAGVARAIMAAGLHPSLGLKHSNPSNPMGLVDDCMEPFRPIVDFLVYDLISRGEMDVSPDAKAALARLLILDMSTELGATPLATCLERFALSLARCYAGEIKKLEIPRRTLPLELQHAKA